MYADADNLALLLNDLYCERALALWDLHPRSFPEGPLKRQ
jgi:hypothetical protein